MHRDNCRIVLSVENNFYGSQIARVCVLSNKSRNNTYNVSARIAMFRTRAFNQWITQSPEKTLHKEAFSLAETKDENLKFSAGSIVLGSFRSLPIPDVTFIYGIGYSLHTYTINIRVKILKTLYSCNYIFEDVKKYLSR